MRVVGPVTRMGQTRSAYTKLHFENSKETIQET
jgi:hypothetical protein